MTIPSELSDVPTSHYDTVVLFQYAYVALCCFVAQDRRILVALVLQALLRMVLLPLLLLLLPREMPRGGHPLPPRHRRRR